MLFLTIPFSYIITVILAYLPEAEKGEETSASGVLLTLFYVLVVVGVCTPMYRFMVSAGQWAFAWRGLSVCPTVNLENRDRVVQVNEEGSLFQMATLTPNYLEYSIRSGLAMAIWQHS